MKKPLTLCIIHRDQKILLGLKKRGFGAGHWNGFGGKVLEGETIDECVEREVFEEAGVKIENPIKVGIIEFAFQNNQEVLEVHIYRTEKFSGEPIESEEMLPRWFLVNEIPFEKMWSDDKFWLPLLLSGKKFKGKFLFDRPSNAEYAGKIISKDLNEVEVV